MPLSLFKVEPWSAFKGKYPGDSTVEHRIIIVYKNEDVIKYFYVTSKIEKMRKALKSDIGALVDNIDNRDWDALTKASCIMCNNEFLHITSEEEMRRAYQEDRLIPLGKIPDTLKRKIISAICASESFDEEEKALYTATN